MRSWRCGGKRRARCAAHRTRPAGRQRARSAIPVDAGRERRGETASWIPHLRAWTAWPQPATFHNTVRLRRAALIAARARSRRGTEEPGAGPADPEVRSCVRGMRRSLGLALILGALCAPPARAQDQTAQDPAAGPRPWSDPPAKAAGAPAAPEAGKAAAVAPDAPSPAVRPARLAAKPARIAPGRRAERRAAVRPRAEARVAARPRRRVAEAPPRAVVRPPALRPGARRPPGPAAGDARRPRRRPLDRRPRRPDPPGPGRRLPVMRRTTIEDPMAGGCSGCAPSTTKTSRSSSEPRPQGEMGAEQKQADQEDAPEGRGRDPAAQPLPRDHAEERRRQGDEGGGAGGERQRALRASPAARATVETVKERPRAWISPSRPRFSAWR